VGVTYSYTRVNPGGTLSGANANGGYGYVEYNFKKVGLVADLGANYVGNGRLSWAARDSRVALTPVRMYKTWPRPRITSQWLSVAVLILT
jgi:hypothetical protein